MTYLTGIQMIKMFNDLASRIANWIELKLFKDEKPRLKLIKENNSRYEKVALIVGHTKKSQGAISYNGVSEYEYNTKVANAVVDLVETKKVKVFYRDKIGRKGAAYKAARWAGDESLSIELHFNAFRTAAYGTETLALSEDEDSIEIANALSKAISVEFGTKLRSKYGVKEVPKNGRGGMNLQYCKEAGIESSILVEPFFGNKETTESKKFMEGTGWISYAKCLAKFIDSI